MDEKEFYIKVTKLIDRLKDQQAKTERKILQLKSFLIIDDFFNDDNQDECK
jgi:hypothetical protein